MQAIRTGIFAALALGAAGLILFGPRGRSRDAEVGSATLVTYWEKWTGNEGAQMQQIVDDFNNTVGREKGIRVRYLSVSNVNQKTLIATAAGVPPDIAGVWDGQVPQFAAMDALEPLDELAAAHGITPDHYKPVYWKGCTYEGRLYGLISTPSAVALHYNKRVIAEEAAALQAAGLDPSRPPTTLDELDRMAGVLDRLQRDKTGEVRSVERVGYLPLEPGWFLVHTCLWFGGDLYDQATGQLRLDSPENIRAFEWIRSYSIKLGGARAMSEFRSGLGGFNSPLNPFLTGTVVMEQQGPWMANYIEDLRPDLNRWRMPKKTELDLLRKGRLSVEQRRANYVWGAAPFPSAVAGLTDVTFAGFDVLVIPRGARHKRQAFEFIAYVNRQEVMEKLCALHCKNSPLRKASERYLREHPNPYIEVFERLASSPNARGIPPVPIWPEIGEELFNAAQKVYLLTQTPVEALREAQLVSQRKLDTFRQRDALRRRPGRSARSEVPAP